MFSFLHSQISQRDEIEGRIVKTAGRRGEYTARVRQCSELKVILLGKVLYIELEGPGKMPVLHFGMTGMLRVRDFIRFRLRSI